MCNFILEKSFYTERLLVFELKKSGQIVQKYIQRLDGKYTTYNV